MKTKYEKYANVLLQNGVNIQEGQILYIYAPIEERDFITILVKQAYLNHAKYVHVEFYDPEVNSMKAKYCDDEYLHFYPNYLVQNKISMMNEKVALLKFSTGITPSYQIDPARQITIQKGMVQAMMPFTQISRGSNLVNSCSSVLPTRYWAKQVFPDLDEESAYEKLWNNLLSIGKTQLENPVEAWHTHVNNIIKRRTYLNEQQFVKLHIKNNVTDVTIQLCKDHVWAGGCEYSIDGIASMPNYPTEEIFSTMNKNGINGVVHSTKPFIYENHIIDDFELTFENGKIINAIANVGQLYLDELLNLEEGTRYCGEIALLAGETEISKTNTVYKNTLLDENAACHMAIGCAYLSNLKTPISHCQEDFDKMNINFASVHYDFMFGSSDINVTAYDEENNAYPILVEGNWTI